MTFLIEHYTSYTVPGAIFDAAFRLVRQNMAAMYKAYRAGGWRDSEKMAEMREDATQFFVARTIGLEAGDQTLAAFVSFQETSEDDINGKPENVLYCYEMQTTATHRRSGLGTRLMGQLEMHARSRKLGKVMLTVLRANTNAVEFYGRLGYAQDPTSPTLFLHPREARKYSYHILSKSI